LQARLASLEKERDELRSRRPKSRRQGRSRAAEVTNPQMQKSLQDVQAQTAARQLRIQATTMDIEERTRPEDGRGKKQIAAIQSARNSPPSNRSMPGYCAIPNWPRQNYSELVKRREASETAQNLEEHKAGQNLEVLDRHPAEAPRSRTVSPSRESAHVGLVAGIVLAGGKEVKNTSLKKPQIFGAYTNLPVLSSIPLLENALLVRKKRRLFWLACRARSSSGPCHEQLAYYYYFGHT